VTTHCQAFLKPLLKKKLFLGKLCAEAHFILTEADDASKQGE
jgi:hypothetical protein